MNFFEQVFIAVEISKSVTNFILINGSFIRGRRFCSPGMNPVRAQFKHPNDSESNIFVSRRNLRLQRILQDIVES